MPRGARPSGWSWTPAPAANRGRRPIDSRDQAVVLPRPPAGPVLAVTQTGCGSVLRERPAETWSEAVVGTTPTQWITLAHVTLRVVGLLFLPRFAPPFPAGV